MLNKAELLESVRLADLERKRVRTSIVERFISEMVDRTDEYDDYELCSDVYISFVDWCQGSGVSVSKPVFWREWSSLVSPSVSARFGSKVVGVYRYTRLRGAV